MSIENLNQKIIENAMIVQDASNLFILAQEAEAKTSAEKRLVEDSAHVIRTQSRMLNDLIEAYLRQGDLLDNIYEKINSLPLIKE